jgi:hypothetical protein
MSVGAQFRAARTERNLSIADVSQHTKIQPWVLEALEADRLVDLMSPIYVKGFVTTYAKFLRLDPEALLPQLPWPAPEPEPEEFTPVSRPAPLRIHLPWPLVRRAALAASGIAVVVGVVLVNPLRWVPRLALPKPSAPTVASVAPVREQPQTPSPSALTIRPAQPLELEVMAHRATWVRVRADGKLLTQQWLKRGANERWTARKQFELVIAKPSQVDLTLNGQPISPFAIAHRGRLAITHQGVTPLPDDRF